jgi:DHA1 family solute carrier family 18 vesicular amine transporter 1/2
VLKLVVFVSAMAVVQALFFATLAPLLPSFSDELGLSKAEAGLLVGMFPIGQGVAALPVGLLASRVRVKRFALTGLVVLAVTSIGFGVVDNYAELLGARFLQGVGAALCWSSGLAWLVDTVPRRRRGEMIGIFTGAGAAGQVIGPAVGGLAVLVSRAEVFAGMAGAAFLLAIIGSRFPGPAKGEHQSLALIRKTHSSRAVLSGMWLIVVPALLIGTIFVLGPLRLSRLGWGPVGIAGTFLCSAALGVLGRPLVGRWADRNGPLRAIRLLLLAAIPLTLVIPWLNNRWLLSVFLVFAVSTYGFLWGPSMTLVSHAYDEAGIALVLGFALIGLTIGVGFFVGSAVGGEIARLAGDATAYSVPAAMCLGTVGMLALRRDPSSSRRANAVDIDHRPG